MNTNNLPGNEPTDGPESAGEVVSDLRGGLQDRGIYTSHEKTGPTSGRMQVTLSRQAEQEIVVRSYLKQIESAFDSMAKLTTDGQRKFTRERITRLIQKLEEVGGDATAFRDRLGNNESQS